MKTRFALLVLFTTVGIFISSNDVSAQSSAPTEIPNSDPREEEWIVSLPSGTTPEDVLKSINDSWATEKNWTNLNTEGLSNSRISVWRFTDRTGQTWIATARAASCETQRGDTLVTLKIVRAASPVGPCWTKRNSAVRSVQPHAKPQERVLYY